jgi:hypothetical protein
VRDSSSTPSVRSRADGVDRARFRAERPGDPLLPTLGGMTRRDGNLPRQVLAGLAPDADHRDAEHLLRRAGWGSCGAGDWALALRAPDGSAVARISPFDPTGPYAAELYRQAAHTRQVPALFAHRRLAGGGDLQLLERLQPVPDSEAAAFHRAIGDRAPAVAELADIIHRIHRQAMDELPWCGPIDHNPTNVMRAADGRLVVLDLFYADGPNLYATAASNPDLVAARIPRAERRFMTEIPLAASGPWEPGAQEALRSALDAADARATGSGPSRSLSDGGG